MSDYPVVEIPPRQSPNLAPRRDPLYLFACHLEWQINGNVSAFQELQAALEDPCEETRLIAESLLNDPPHAEPLRPRSQEYRLMNGAISEVLSVGLAVSAS